MFVFFVKQKTAYDLRSSDWSSDVCSSDLEVKSKGTSTNAFGSERTFLGDPKDSGTLREIAGYVGQSDTAGNMNRSQYEIDHGYIPANFRDGVNPDAHDEPRTLDRSKERSVGKEGDSKCRSRW